MNTIHTAEYFEKYIEVLSKKYKKDCDYENDLNLLLPNFDAIPEEMREKAKNTVTKMYAEKIVKTATEELLKKQKMISDIKAGRAGLGYTTKVQEVSAWHDINEGFEFSCYKLKKFKDKYEIA